LVLFEFLSGYITDFITSIGYVGIFLLMTLESACMPVPSEIVMPFSGFAAQRGDLDFFIVGLVGSLGCLAGSILSFVIGQRIVRPILNKHGEVVFIKKHEMELAEKWFGQYGVKVVFVARLLPIIRTFISLPAGIIGMDFKKFSFYSFVGSVPWCFALAYAGVILGDNWSLLEKYWIYLDILTVIGIIVVVVYVAYHAFIIKNSVQTMFKANNK
jgi:membrane protein DedA with SNARE-associated domain